ncbi:hypothetical protein DEU56DRAFT_874123 [Suillus clintonianus]|uniref:uncharacterized protein n=1 Tax=Suillus clintonianus TaxID=1904413 RepID=UPI001B87056E|nr:uncharacterized protein DEU56DRAFT_874123 [Suillus clintonianus]KAG2116963.1 hypothetical protein DEU56DRAFT_874123 [Suillus clintonianus]
MADMDVFSAMGIVGFGKAAKKRELDPNRFDKTKREELVVSLIFFALEAKPLIPSSGPSKVSIRAPSQSDEDSDDPGPSLPPAGSFKHDTDGVGDEDKEDDDTGSADDEPEYDPSAPSLSAPDFPITHEATLKEHTKVISALTVDPSGARVLSGSHDYDCKLWDFGGMTTQTRSFKTWEPAGSYYVNDLKYSNDGQQFLVISGTLQAKLFDREGEEKATFVKGDMYIRDMKHTAGHVGELSSCAWHPKDKQYFITSSADSTIRIWDVENRRKQKSVIVVKSKERGARTKVTTCAYSTDGTLIGGACLDGALHMWQASSNFVRPNMTIEGAHTKGTDVGSLVFSVDGRTVLTRGGDDTVKLWDLRAFKRPLASHSGATTLYPGTNAVFSPDEKYILTGTGASTKGGRGKLVLLSRESLSVAKEIDMDTTPVKVVWHSKINQIITGLANGTIAVLYSPETSLNGAKLLLSKGSPKRPTVEDLSDALAAPTILTPHALPMFKDGEGIVKGMKRKRDKDRMDPRKSRRPELPVTGPGRGGRVGASATQHVVQNLVRDTTRDEDPREALLKYAKMADEDPQWTSAWRQNQPKPVFANVSEDEEEEEEGQTLIQFAYKDPMAGFRFPQIQNLLSSENVTLATNTEQQSILSTAVNGDNVVNANFKSSIPIHPPSGTPRPMEGQLLDDVKMAEETTVNDSDEVPITNGVNGVHTTDSDGDVHMDQSPTTNGHSHDIPRQSSLAPADSAGPPTSRATSNFNSPQHRSDAVDDDDEARPPPAKRARVLIPFFFSTLKTGSPPPITASSVQTNGDTVVSSPTPAPTYVGTGISTLSPVQHRFCLSTVRSLKKLKDASAFLHPVDPVVLNIPHYPTIIKTPMDLGTIERKLMASNPAKPDTSSNIPRYYSAEEFVSDVRLVFSNCITFNGPDHVIAQAGKHVEAVFDKQIKQLPPPAEVCHLLMNAACATHSPARRPSTSVPVIRRNEAEQASARPKREIHPPPPKDLPYADVPKKMRKVKVPKDDGTGEQLKYCGRILSDLQRKQHATIAHPFYEPVDAVKLDIPTYYRVIKKPMDMSTMRKKLEAGEYPNASKFFDDFKLMIRNCFLFNPAGTLVNQAGIELQRLFDEKWKNLPPLRDVSDEEEEEYEDEESEEERNRRIAAMEAQIESMRGNLMALKNKPAKEKKKKEKKEKAPVASTSKAVASRTPKAAPTTNGNKRKTTTKKPMAEDDALSFEQKKDLSEAITNLDGVKLEKVIQIIHEGVPEIRDSTEEIELEIDILPPHVLTKLYNFVLRPLRQPTQKRNRTGKGTGTGGLKRKSMDETAEAEKIRKLEERMRLFDDNNFATPNAAPVPAHQNDSDHSSDSSSDDSSGSESE